MISSYWVAQSIYVDNKINIADLIKNNNYLYYEKLGQLTNINTEALRKP